MRDGPSGDLAARGEAELVEDVLYMIVGRPFADEDGCGDLPVGFPRGYEGGHFSLPPSEWAVLGSCATQRCGALGGGGRQDLHTDLCCAQGRADVPGLTKSS